MREYFDDLSDFELDDNDIIDRLMREWEMEERRKVSGARRAVPKVMSRFGEDNIDDDLDDDSESYDDFDDFDDDY